MMVNRAKRALVACAMGGVGLGGVADGTVWAQDDGAVCEDLSTGHLTTTDGQSTTITAPEGMLIDEVCVKAGSNVQGDGPVSTSYDPPVESVTISHPSGKDISHYSVSYVDESDTTTTAGGGTPTTDGQSTPTGSRGRTPTAAGGGTTSGGGRAASAGGGAAMTPGPGATAPAQLPNTGPASDGAVVVGTVALAAGIAMMLLSRRRTA